MPVQSIQPGLFFQIRPEQIEALHQESFPRHLQRIVAKVWPEQTATMTDDALMERLEASIERARGHGIENRDNITRFVHLTFLLGRTNFDVAPETSWAATILGWEMDESKKLLALEKRAEIEQEKALIAAAVEDEDGDPDAGSDVGPNAGRGSSA